MILEIDMGNTWTKWRVLDGSSAPSCRKTLSTEFPQKDILSLNAIRRIRFASVCASSITERAIALLSAQWSLTVERAQTQVFQAGLQNSYLHPSHMGVDRWLAMLAAYSAAECECLVVSCGTAVTIDFIGSGGVHEGGYILPGLMMMRSALLSGTGRINFEPGVFGLLRTPGKSTAEAVEHGAVQAVASVIERACRDGVDRWGTYEMFITGGDAIGLMKQLSLPVDNINSHHVEELVLDGLQYALP